MWFLLTWYAHAESYYFRSSQKLKNLICLRTYVKQKRNVQIKGWNLTRTAIDLVILQQDGWVMYVRSFSQVQWLIFHFREGFFIFGLTKCAIIIFLINRQRSTLVEG
jgi:hypothetical protein